MQRPFPDPFSHARRQRSSPQFSGGAVTTGLSIHAGESVAFGGEQQLRSCNGKKDTLQPSLRLIRHVTVNADRDSDAKRGAPAPSDQSLASLKQPEAY